MKRKSMSLLMGSLLTVCLVGVGFASWIIIEGDKELVTGTVNVETVEKKTLTITATWDEANDATGTNDSVFSFGSSDDADTGWLRNTTGEGERLSLNLDVSIDNHEYLSSVKATIAVKTNASSFAEAVTAKYVTNPVLKVGDTVLTDGAVPVTEYEDGEFTINASIAWGDFWGMNPYAFYNTGHKASDKVGATETTYAEHAYTHLGALKTKLNGVTFEITIEVE